MTLSAGYDILVRVEEEALAAAFMFSHAERLWGEDVNFLASAMNTAITLPQLRRTETALEATFTLRLFSSFEFIIRDFWVHTVRDTQPDMRTLIDIIAARRSITDDDRDGAHQVREYRNAIVHDGARELQLTFDDCMKALAKYLRWFPQSW